MTELQNRLITSIPLLIVLYLSLTYKIVLFLTLSLITFLLFSEIYYILNKIFKQKEKLKLFLLSLFSYLYIILFVVIIWYILNKNSENNLYLILLLSICIFSDIGGYFFGKILKGKKLTKISPKKTYSGIFFSTPRFIFQSYIISNYCINSFTDWRFICVLFKKKSKN